MISIRNMTPNATDDPGGERTYMVTINGKVITTFDHCRRDGLEACLRAAADAVRNSWLADAAAVLMSREGSNE